MSSDDPDSTNKNEMRVPFPSTTRIETLTSNITSILSRICSTTSSKSIINPVRLVAVSKLKPASDILALHSPPQPLHHEGRDYIQHHFGENYVQELLEKSRLLPKSIRWHFIGGLQSNKCVQLAREVENLWAVESVDSVKKARLLDKGRSECKSSGTTDGDAPDNSLAPLSEPLRVFVQVNTSDEDSKSGLSPKSSELVELCKTIRDECSNLKLQGLMTIGAIARSQATTAETENADFVSLRENRDWVAEQLNHPKEELELSMGMSEDFEGAIVLGSGEVRVGSTIFGERPQKKEAKVLENTEEEKT